MGSARRNSGDRAERRTTETNQVSRIKERESVERYAMWQVHSHHQRLNQRETGRLLLSNL